MNGLELSYAQDCDHLPRTVSPAFLITSHAFQFSPNDQIPVLEIDSSQNSLQCGLSLAKALPKTERKTGEQVIA
jgi:hypothetical protein